MSAQQIMVQTLGGKCAECGSIEKLQIHHKDENRKHNDFSNLVLLCQKCHHKKHGWHQNGTFKRTNIYIVDEELWEFADLKNE